MKRRRLTQRGVLLLMILLFIVAACELGSHIEVPYDSTITIENIALDEHVEAFTLIMEDTQETYTITDLQGDQVEGGILEYTFTEIKGRGVVSLSIENEEIEDYQYEEVEGQEVERKDPHTTFELVYTPYIYKVTFEVLDEEGEPLEGVDVQLEQEEETTNEEGEAIFEGLAPGVYDYSIHKSGYEEVVDSLEIVDEDVQETINLVEQDATTYRVTFLVQDEENDPLEGALVSLDGEELSTNEEGEAIFEGLAPGVYDYSIHKSGYEEVEDSLEIEDEDLHVEVHLELKTYSVTFLVEDYLEEPLEGVLVELNSQEEETDDEGRAVFSGIPQGEYTYSIIESDYEEVEGLLKIEDEDLLRTITLIGIEFAGGEGTIDSPYLILTPNHLDNMREYLDSYFQLVQNIDLDEMEYPDHRGWQPIGDEGDPFTGNLDGYGYQILNLAINRPLSSYIGLFGYVHGALLKDIHLEDTFIQGNEYVGSLAGYNDQGLIQDSSALGRVDGDRITGGLIGMNTGDILNTYTDVRTKSYDSIVGGLTGINEGYIYHSYSLGRIEAGIENNSSIAGGLIGQNTGLVSKSFALGNVEGIGRYVGGFVGEHQGERIERSFAFGSVESNSGYVGGFVGSISHDATISECYAIGEVTGTQYVGAFAGTIGRFTSEGESPGFLKESYASGYVNGGQGLIGHFVDGSVLKSYYDKDRSGLDEVTNKGFPKTTEEMMQEETFVDWDFSFIWTIDEANSYPYFRWQGSENIPRPYP